MRAFVVLRNLWRRIRVRPPRGPSVDLTPSEQVVLRLFHRLGRASFDEVDHEIGTFRAGLPRPPAFEVVATLIQEGLIEARIQEDAGEPETIYSPTPKGNKLRGRIPEVPRTVTEFWF